MDSTNGPSSLRMSILHNCRCCQNLYCLFSKKYILSVHRRTPLTDRRPFDGPSYITIDFVNTFVFEFLQKKYSKCPSTDPTDRLLFFRRSVLHNRRHCENLCF